MNSLIFASLKERSFDYAAWEKKVKDCYQDAAPGIIALEEKAQKNNLDKRNKRLAILEEKWPEILRTIKESLPSSAEMENCSQVLVHQLIRHRLAYLQNS